ncbi:AAA family ATPase [Streptomyces sp. NPDC057621]|uniref:AAA family ATPase n=1 Tax=Streptomyces sp. NPDC057621 TaxID=3346186 RepID=UPI0036B255D4
MDEVTTPGLEGHDGDGGEEGQGVVGRAVECALLDGLAEAPHDRGAAVLLCGDPGIGKTVLLDRTARHWDGRVLRTRGVESEAVLPYGVLADLLLPLRAYFAEVPLAQQRALEACLALSEAEDVNPYAVCVGTLGVLAAAGETAPLAVLIDDVHWADPSSSQVLQFVARRLAAERIVLVMATRLGGESGIGWEGVDQVVLRPLAVEECRELLVRHGVDPSSRTAERVVAISRGNPLILVECAGAWKDLPETDVRTGEDWGVPGPLVERAWLSKMRTLSRGAQDALVYVAACRSAQFALLERALAAEGLSLSVLEEAEEARLVKSSGDVYELRHPVLRPILLDRCTLARRLLVYRVLAEASEGELSIWYLAAATAGPDEQVAAALVAEGEQARRRGALGATARAWHRAAELSPRTVDRTTRLLDAAWAAFHSGATSDALSWSGEAQECSEDARTTADIALLRGQVCSWVGDPGRGHQAIVAAAQAVEPVDAFRACALLCGAVIPAAMDGRVATALDIAERCAAMAASLHPAPPGPGAPAPAPGSMPSPADLQQLATVLLGAARALVGQVREGRELLLKVRQQLPRNWPTQHQQLAIQLGEGLSWVDEDAAARELLGAVIAQAQRDGVPALLPYALSARCQVESWNRWTAARADGEEALRWGQEFGHAAMTSYAFVLLARLDALRGDRAGCEARVAACEQYGGPGMHSLALFAESALGSAALGTGDLDACRTHLERSFALAADVGLDNPNLLPFVADLVEAHVRAGSLDRAAQVTSWLTERAAATGLAWPQAAHARCRALLADTADEAEEWLAQAEKAHTRREMVFELARTRLVHGEIRRRFRRPAAARQPLLAAQREFAGLGATSWADRAAAELTAAGHRGAPHRQRTQLADILTGQELQVARAIAAGMSNVEAATALFLSRKTVEAHLTRVYRKLNIRSRADLARTLARAGAVE